jgi:hypothetical protein
VLRARKQRLGEAVLLRVSQQFSACMCLDSPKSTGQAHFRCVSSKAPLPAAAAPAAAAHRPGKRKAGPQGSSSSSHQQAFFTESHLEPGVMLCNGVNPVRPGARPCPHYMRQSWCPFKAKCR